MVRTAIWKRRPDAVAAIVDLFLHRHKPDESFGDAVARLGADVFYAAA